MVEISHPPPPWHFLLEFERIRNRFWRELGGHVPAATLLPGRYWLGESARDVRGNRHVLCKVSCFHVFALLLYLRELIDNHGLLAFLRFALPLHSREFRLQSLCFGIICLLDAIKVLQMLIQDSEAKNLWKVVLKSD